MNKYKGNYLIIILAIELAENVNCMLAVEAIINYL
jgi:hypothetical protein